MRLLLFVMAIIASSVSCAYYNIYWMAQHEYDQALEKIGTYDFWDPYSQPKLRGESSKLIDSCIKRCGKILLLYPKSRWVDDALLLMGNCFVLKQDFPKAMKKYEEILTLFAGSPLSEEARYMKAYTLVLEDSPEQALGEIEKILEVTRNRLIRQKSIYLRARIHFEKGNWEDVISDCRSYLDEFPKGEKADDVRLRLAKSLLRVGKAEEVEDLLKKVTGRNDELGFAASITVGKALEMIGKDDRALSVFERIKKESEIDTTKARALMEIASMRVSQNDYKGALSALAEADSILPPKENDLRSELLFTMGNIYEKYMGDLHKAAETYSKASKLESTFADAARMRAKALKDLEHYQSTLTDSVPDPPEKTAKMLLLIGEIYEEDLGWEQQAIASFKTVIDSFPTTASAAKAMLHMASIMESEGDSLANSYYRKVIKLFPRTVYANFARHELNLPLVDLLAEPTDTLAGPDTLGATDPSEITVPEDLADTTRVGSRLGTDTKTQAPQLQQDGKHEPGKDRPDTSRNADRSRAIIPGLDRQSPDNNPKRKD